MSTRKSVKIQNLNFNMGPGARFVSTVTRPFSNKNWGKFFLDKTSVISIVKLICGLNTALPIRDYITYGRPPKFQKKCRTLQGTKASGDLRLLLLYPHLLCNILYSAPAI